MDINTIQGMSAYAAYNIASADEGLVQTNQQAQQNGAAVQESTQAAVQEAFQVDITQEALAMQAENTEKLPPKENAAQVPETQTPEAQASPGQTQQSLPSQGQTQQVSQLVDILA